MEECHVSLFKEINKSYSTEWSDVKMQKSGQAELSVTSVQWQAFRNNMAASLDFFLAQFPHSKTTAPPSDRKAVQTHTNVPSRPLTPSIAQVNVSRNHIYIKKNKGKVGRGSHKTKNKM